MSHISFSAFVKITLISLFAGIAIGVLVGNTDVFNFLRNGAAAEKQHIANERQATQDTIDLQYYELERREAYEANLAVIEADKSAEIANIEEAKRLQAARRNLQLAIETGWAIVCMLIVLILSLAAGIAVKRLLCGLADRILAAVTNREVPALAHHPEPASRVNGGNGRHRRGVPEALPEI